MSLRQRFMIGMLSGAGSVVVKSALNLLVIPVMIAFLGLDAFGFYILLVSILEISMLVDFGATSALVKLLSGGKAEDRQHREYLMVGHSLFAVIALVFLAIGLLLSPLLPGQFQLTSELMPIASLSFTLITIEVALCLYGCYFHSVLLSHCAHQWSNIADTVQAVTMGVGTVILLWAGFDLVAVLAVRLVAALLRLLIMSVQSLRLEPRAFLPGVPLRLSTCREVLGLGFHAMMINFSIIISHKIDDLVIARFLPIGAVAVYELVFRFVGIIIQICLKLNEGTYPMFSRLATVLGTADGKHEAQTLFLRMSGLLNVTALLLLTLVVSYFPELLALFSAKHVTLAQTLPLLAVAAPIALSGVLQMPAGAWLFSWEHHRLMTVSSLVTAGANLILSVILVQHLGIIGVALGTLIPQLLQHQLVLIAVTCRELDISLGGYCRQVHLPAAIPVAIVLLWVALWKPWVTACHPQTLAIGLTGGTALLLGGAWWLWRNSTSTERKHFLIRIRAFGQSGQGLPTSALKASKEPSCV